MQKKCVSIEVFNTLFNQNVKLNRIDDIAGGAKTYSDLYQMAFEQKGGVDALYELQYDQNEEIYEKTQNLMRTHFDIDDDDNRMQDPVQELTDFNRGQQDITFKI